jgi:hypothetical protein
MTATDVIERVKKIAATEAKKSAQGAPGTVQSPRGSNNVKYNTAYYGHPVSSPTGEDFAWCVVFLWWVLRMAGVPSVVFPKAANVFWVRQWFKDRDRYLSTSAPKAGDLVVFKSSHIGLVERADAATIVTIEGNASHMVKRRSYRRTHSNIDGYCRPAYDKVKEDVMNKAQEAKLDRVLEVLAAKGTSGPEDTIEILFTRVRELDKNVEKIMRKIGVNP